jgi:hypothetical protein
MTIVMEVELLTDEGIPVAVCGIDARADLTAREGYALWVIEPNGTERLASTVMPPHMIDHLYATLRKRREDPHSVWGIGDTIWMEPRH